ncbi:MAG: recombination regulator RecX [Spirochaetales bacterium]|jgi:regulatory protein|nr:recombination regulator RecX [Spirochaetales bacterium]
MPKNSYSTCYDRAAGLLSAAEHCTRGLERKLLARGYEEKEVAETLQRLTAENLLNDERFAGLWIEFRQKRRNEGGRRLTEGLLRRGVRRDIAEAAVRRAAQTDEYLQALRRAREKLLAGGCSDEQALVSLLLRKGFSRSEIKKCEEDD